MSTFIGAVLFVVMFFVIVAALLWFVFGINVLTALQAAL
jgi:hypothetical protein